MKDKLREILQSMESVSLGSYQEKTKEVGSPIVVSPFIEEDLVIVRMLTERTITWERQISIGKAHEKRLIKIHGSEANYTLRFGKYDSNGQDSIFQIPGRRITITIMKGCEYKIQESWKRGFFDPIDSLIRRQIAEKEGRINYEEDVLRKVLEELVGAPTYQHERFEIPLHPELGEYILRKNHQRVEKQPGITHYLVMNNN